ncbi:chaplin [Streptomyces sp. NBC_01264]|uniref:chaplin n=1 Tax=Streptomyces sp. NBC_01264 TaxID=2903804 RepID=UPI00225885D3|nr:chaplin [Streptomyces sp. NBC_01264]MCX4783612.1 chaplin [Streptomyces sp. NBC_01264]
MRIRTAFAALVLAAAGTLAAGTAAAADATAEGIAYGSPGFLSGNLIQVPIDIQANFCGNSLNLLAAGNPAAFNVCVND